MSDSKIHIGPDRKIPEQPTCPYCRGVMDGAFQVSQDEPKSKFGPGALVLHAECGNFGCVTETMGIRKLAAGELDALQPGLRHAMTSAAAACKLKRAVREN